MDLSSIPALGIKALRLHGLHHHAAVSATYCALRLFLPDVVLEVMSFWQGGHWNIREWREALHHARGHFPLDVLEPRDFPIIALYPTLSEFGWRAFADPGVADPAPRSAEREVGRPWSS